MNSYEYCTFMKTGRKNLGNLQYFLQSMTDIYTSIRNVIIV